MQLYLAFVYLLKLILRKFRKAFNLIPTFPFQALIDFDKYFNSKMDPPAVLYLGDSVIERIAEQDNDKRTLGQMVVDELLPDTCTAVISFSAYHISVYYELLKGFEVTRSHPKVVILPINIRSFSPQWDLQPRWQYKEEILALKKYRYSSAKIITRLFDDRYFVPKYLQNKYRNLKVNYPLTSLDTIGQIMDVIASKPTSEDARVFRKRQIFIFNYAHPLAEDHRKLVDLTRILDFLLSLGIKVFVYITPINMTAGIKYVGSGFQRQVLDNAQVVESVLRAYQTRSDFHYANWCMLFSSNLFFYDDLATEHINQDGRLKLAELISHEVHTLLGKFDNEEVGKKPLVNL